MKYILLIFISFSALSCSSFLDEDVYTTVNVEDYYKTQADIEAALVAAYSKFQDANYYDNGIFQLGDLPTDMLNTRWTNNVYDRMTTDAGNSQYRNFWASCWEANNAISSVITFGPKAEMEESVRSQLIAEARFLRALNYFNLVRTYGQVPLVLEAIVTVEDNLFPKTVSRDFVYALIIEDLKYAELNLAPVNTARATLGAAKTLLGKVYLTYAGYTKSEDNPDLLIKGDPMYYQLAADKLKEVIDGGYYSLFDDYADVFSNETENGIEHIFSIQFKQGALAGTWGGEGSLKQTHFAPQNFGITHSSYGTYMATPAFYAKFDSSDSRRDVTFLDKFKDQDGTNREYKANGTGNLDFPYVRKYIRDLREGGVGDFSTASARDGEENTIVLRYADVLLMHSEALYFANGGVSDDVVSGINEVRDRAGLPALTSAEKADFINTLLDEREKELCFEGHGWFDYVRLGQLNERAARSGNTNKFYYWPIPGNEITKNDNLLQSIGW